MKKPWWWKLLSREELDKDEQIGRTQEMLDELTQRVDLFEATMRLIQSHKKNIEVRH